MISLKALQKTAAELNEVLMLQPPINTKEIKVNVLMQEIIDTIPLIRPDEDEFSPDVQEVLDELVKDVQPEPEPKEEEEMAAEVPLDEQILSATKIRELKEIAMTHDVFKPLRGKFASYKTTDALANAMLDILDAPEKQEEEAPKKEVKKEKKVEKEKEVPKEEVKVQKPTKEKNEKGISFAKIIDEVVRKGGRFEDMIVVLEQVKKERNLKVPVSAGAIKVHINYRLKCNPDYFKGIIITAEGITYGGKN